MRLIDADKFWKLVKDFRDTSPEETSKRKFVCNAILLALMDEKETPTIDAVPVVRCRECKHFNMQKMECENDAISTDHEGGASYSLNFYLDDFCSYGERKEGADNGLH